MNSNNISSLCILLASLQDTKAKLLAADFTSNSNNTGRVISSRSYEIINDDIKRFGDMLADLLKERL